MDPINILSIAARHADWLSLRQSVIAGNIANASTPGFEARAVSGFSTSLDQAQLAMRVTSQGHVEEAPGQAGGYEFKPGSTWETSHSGNSVRLEQELIKASEVNRAMQLNTSVSGAFYRMLAMTVRG